MTLDQFILISRPGIQTYLAKELSKISQRVTGRNITGPNIWAWRTGKRPVPPYLIPDIVRLSEGKIAVEDLVSEKNKAIIELLKNNKRGI